MVIPAGFSGLGFGAAFAAIMAGWEQIRNVVQRIIGIFIVTLDMQGCVPKAVQIYCWHYLKRSPSPFRFYHGVIRYIRPLKRHGPVAYEVLGEKGQLFWKGWRPIWIQNHRDYHGRVVIRYIRFMFDASELIPEILNTAMTEIPEEGTSKTSNRFRVIRLAGMSGKDVMGLGMDKRSASGQAKGEDTPPITSNSANDDDALSGSLVGWRPEDIGETQTNVNPLDRLALSPEVEDVVEEIKRWYASKDWYLERQIPWRRGILMYGIPGTGKSSLVKALAQHMGIPIYLFDISTMDNQEFHSNYQRAMGDTPAIALIEDIDAVFHGRENVVTEKGQGLTYDCLLNTISGVESSDGLLLVVTTNNLEHVDTALGIPQPGLLSSRPGRIDRAIEMRTLDKVGRTKLATRIMGGCHSSWIAYLVAKGENDTGAQFEDRCTTAALNLFWSEDPQQPAPVNGYHHEDKPLQVEVAHMGHWATDKQICCKAEVNQP